MHRMARIDPTTGEVQGVLDIIIRVDTPTQIMFLSTGGRWVKRSEFGIIRKGKTT